MVKKTLFQINLTNRGFYSLIAILVLILIGLGVYAYNSGLSPSVMGHTLNEIEAPAGCTAGQILSWNGTGWDCINSGGVSGAGNAGYISWWTSASSLGNSVIYQDASNNIGIGTASPAAKLDVYGDLAAETNKWGTSGSQTRGNDYYDAGANAWNLDITCPDGYYMVGIAGWQNDHNNDDINLVRDIICRRL